MELYRRGGRVRGKREDSGMQLVEERKKKVGKANSRDSTLSHSFSKDAVRIESGDGNVRSNSLCRSIKISFCHPHAELQPPRPLTEKFISSAVSRKSGCSRQQQDRNYSNLQRRHTHQEAAFCRLLSRLSAIPLTYFWLVSGSCATRNRLPKCFARCFARSVICHLFIMVFFLQVCVW